MEREVKRLAHPDIPVWLIFEELAQPATLPGSASTDQLHQIACQLHNLDENQPLRYLLKGMPLPPGIALSETALANTADLRVHVKAVEWPVKRGCRSNSAAASSGVAASHVRHGGAPPRMAPTTGGCPHLFFE